MSQCILGLSEIREAIKEIPQRLIVIITTFGIVILKTFAHQHMLHALF